ncbi:MAG: DUF5112 domain-containing protein [Prevotella sp.]|nr:DUF5112 domain-containing protein [Prevotella sp.]
MWLRHALKLLVPTLLISACSPSGKETVDRLNSVSYAYHYRNIDSTEAFAQRAFDLSADYSDGRAEALNNLAFVDIVRMNYADAQQHLDQIAECTDNQLELLVAYIQQMRLCQRMSRNRAFYDYRAYATKALQRINEERSQLDDRQQHRLVYAESEMAIVTSTYYYYIGLERQSIEAIESMSPDVEQDTAQYLNYLYNIGAGGIITHGTQAEINQREFDHLMRCYLLAGQAGYPYFVANSLEALAEHLVDSVAAQQLVVDNLPAMKYLNPTPVADDRLPICLADDALSIFTDYGDVYQIAGAYRTLASAYLARDDYEMALCCLEQALADSIINQAPDLVASIREQMSVAYAAIDDKQQSDANRNIYLDLQEQTRQDRSLEARAAQLEHSLSQLNLLLWAVAVATILLFLLIYYVNRRVRHNTHDQVDEQLQEREDELNEQLALARLGVENGLRTHLEQRAKVSLVNSITPFIDRILHEVRRLPKDKTTTTADDQQRIDYVRELTDEINHQNDVLTHWIQLRQGRLSLHIETFALQELFDMLQRGQRSFMLKGIAFDVHPTTAHVKADRVLTLFMLNTLADNARKFTSEGGRVTVSATEQEDYVEISVADTGVGMTEEQLAHVFDHKAISDTSQTSHGFGLLNCKGIIEKYRKISQIFSVCLLAAESEQGRGSRFYFRLPRRVLTLVVLLLSLAGVTSVSAQSLAQASLYADSAYYANIEGCYERTLDYADSCRKYLNDYYISVMPEGSDTLLQMGDVSVMQPEITWFHDSLQINYDIILRMRNESAVAALALHEWPLYRYNNRIYTQLFKELSADTMLDDYCRKMQQSQTNRQVAIILILLLFLGILAALTWQVMQVLSRRARRQQEHQDQLEMMSDELRRLTQEENALYVSNAVVDNTLSTLKHETMYYPSRIRQLIDAGDNQSLVEVAGYYRELYGLFSAQAMNQVSRFTLRLRPLDHEILGDEILFRHLFDILRRQNGQQKPIIDYVARDEHYMDCRVGMNRLTLTPEEAATLFMPHIDHIPYLLCRQIVRDHGEATNRRACAIRAEVEQQQTVIIITLPRICRTSK